MRTPVVLFAYAVHLLRRLPGANRVRRRVTWLSRSLFISSAGLLLVWLSTPTHQRISLSDLAAGNLSSMQSWIIVSGELHDERSFVPGQYSYRLTDPSAPGPSLVVLSTVPLAVGRTTISGDLVGGRDRAYLVQTWVGTLRADTTLAHEIPPPWDAAALALAGLIVLAAQRTSYPMFFRAAPTLGRAPSPASAATASASTISAALRRAGVPADEPVVQVSIALDPAGGPTVAPVGGSAAPWSLRLHSEFTGAVPGELRALSWSQPAIQLRQAGDEVTLGFTVPGERDAVFDALQARARALTAPAGVGTHGGSSSAR